jgi:hypothetical protein
MVAAEAPHRRELADGSSRTGLVAHLRDSVPRGARARRARGELDCVKR